MENTINQLVKAIRDSWSQFTSSVPNEWTSQNPARGQCVVSALVLQDYAGGTLKKYRTHYKGQKEGHYTNLLPGGVELDIARDQYPSDIKLQEAEIILKGYDTLRDKLYSKANTKERYELLKKEVEMRLAKNSLE